MLGFPVRNIPGIRPAQAEFTMWRDEMRELGPLYPVVLPFLLLLFTRAYQKAQERLGLAQLEPIRRPHKRPQS